MEAGKPTTSASLTLASNKLFEPVQFVTGVGPLRAELLFKLGIQRAADLLFFFPRSYEETAPLRSAGELRENERVSVIGILVEFDERITQSGKHILGALLELESQAPLRLVWFNQPYRKDKLKPGDRILATGTLRSTGMSWEMIQPHTVTLAADEIPADQKPLPIYPLTEGISQPALRKILEQGAKKLIPLVDEVLPETIRDKLQVMHIHAALKQIHWPDDMSQTIAARNRFAMQELLVLQLAIGLQRLARQGEALALACPISAKVHARILNRLGYLLTPDQTKAIADVSHDMERTIPMNRLLQGDVGCGKTVVAQYAMLQCVASGFQAVLMAPTEVLAQQHKLTLEKSLASSRVRIGLLTGSLTRSQRAEMLRSIAQGELDLVIGTQALLCEDVVFKNLGLVIVDEQHKFGVEQRARMRRNQSQPHYLVLSATPIPRTIAMTAFGDLDVSIIRDKPPGRSEVKTYLGNTETLSSWWKFVDSQLTQGRQAFVIAPRVESDSDVDVAGAKQVAADLQSGVFAHRRVGLLHGQMSSEEKERILADMSSGVTDILVATTVVEVGIDIPNASVMTILDADRLGLAQLHQLRGRVGRGRHTGYVCAFASAGSESADNARLQIFEKTTDGFELAEKDLELRGPGDVIGKRQHGVADLRIANLSSDYALLKTAQTVAKQMLAEDPKLEDPALLKLRRQVMTKHGSLLGLSDVG